MNSTSPASAICSFALVALVAVTFAPACCGNLKDSATIYDRGSADRALPAPIILAQRCWSTPQGVRCV